MNRRVVVLGTALIASGVIAFMAAPVAHGKPRASVLDADVVEGGSAAFEVTLSKRAKRSVKLDYETAPDSALGDLDYATSSGTLKIKRGKRKGAVAVSALEDTLDEDSEQFVLNLGNPRGARIADGSAIATISDTDDPPVVDGSGVSIQEGNTGTATGNVEVELSEPSGKTVSVDYESTDGSATSGDYSAASGTVSFMPGDVSELVPVSVTGDTTDEPDESFTIDLSNPVNATLGASSQPAVTILDDDPTCQAGDPFTSATFLGSVDGDGSTGGLPAQPDRSQHDVVTTSAQITPCGDTDWFRVTVFESSNVDMAVTANIGMSSTPDNSAPNNGDLDLCVFHGLPSLQSPRTACSTGGPGGTENVCVAEGESFGSDDSFDAYVQVYGEGTAVNASNYQVTVTGNIDPATIGRPCI
ncbi:MAG: large repetitive protein [Solirubrobacterales bacterium]|jgi:hypothetical protein|nr:large repetitive protein [Solirubrobacterales bacterium]